MFAREFAKLHPANRHSDLFIMGEYCVNYHLGRYIVIYYGSFMQVYANLDKDALTQRLRKVLLHEFLHHLESLASMRDLEIEDALQIASYIKKDS